MKTEDTEALGWQRAKPTKSKAWYSRPSCKNCSYRVHHYNSIQYCNTESFFQYSPSSRPTSHLRCGQVEVKDMYLYDAECILFAIAKFLARFFGNYGDLGFAECGCGDGSRVSQMFPPPWKTSPLWNLCLWLGLTRGTHTCAHLLNQSIQTHLYLL